MNDKNQDIEIAVLQNGSYHVDIDGIRWIQSDDTYFIINNKTYSLYDGSLTVSIEVLQNGSYHVGMVMVLIS